ncbi:hypothetical protein I3842_11G176400 [Carya illinoinensis]|nr:hypothetical protein I3842_11G176400 [Carya illinoinensis]
MRYSVADTSTSNASSAKLLDIGNLIILANNDTEVLWQSFDFPTDTILPGILSAENPNLFHLTSWKSTEDPAGGPYSLTMDFLRLEDGYKINYWNDSLLTKSIMWPSNHTSDISRMVLDVSGQLKLQSWSEDGQIWVPLNSSRCGVRGFCGAFSVCNETVDESCSCLTGFKPRRIDARDQGNWGSRCERETDLNCSVNNHDHQKVDFIHMYNVEWPDNGLPQLNINESECESTCLKNCSCVAYAYDCNNKRLSRLCNCTVWVSDLSNLKQLSLNEGNGKDFNLKRAIRDLGNTTESNPSTGNRPVAGDDKNPKPTGSGYSFWTIVILSASLATLILALVVYYVRGELSRKGQENLLLLDLGMNLKTNHSDLRKVMTRGHGDGRKRDVKMPLFSFSSVAAATDNFSAAYKLGEGGFGPVYKGVLSKGGEVAVKRLSRRSGQGWEELKNEAMLIAELQHKNLVKLLGCCIERDEKILVYEYMPNKSLDFFLFGL